MAKKPLGLDKQGIQKEMRFPNYLGDGATALALNSIGSLVGVIVYFYTDKVGIAAAAAGTILFIAKIIDAFTDLGMGWVMDRTKSKWGRARPWFLWMIIPTFIAIITLFMVPGDASQEVKFGVALGTNVFATAIVYTAIAVPFGSMMFYATASTEERSKMGITRAIFGYLVGMVISIGYIPITNALGGDQRAWLIFASGFAVVGALGLVAAFFANPERHPDPPATKDSTIPFTESVRLLFSNRYWVIMLAVQLLVNIIYSLGAGAGIYYVKWVLGNEDLMGLFGLVGLLPVFIGFIIVGPLVRWLGVARTVRVCLLVGIIAAAARIFFPYDLWATLLFGSFVSLATIPMMALGGVLVNNTVTYGEWKFGKRQVGMANAANSFGVKVGGGLGMAIVGWILALGNYDGAAATQPDSAIMSILVISIGVPLVTLVAMYAFMHFYDLDTRYAQIVKDLEERAEKKDDTPAPTTTDPKETQ